MKKPNDTPAIQALLKRSEGGKLNKTELARVRAYENRQQKAMAESLLSKLPKAEYCRLADRQHKLIDDAARQYGLPIKGKTVNLFRAVKALHDLIADNAKNIGCSQEDRELKSQIERQKIAKLEMENDKLAIALRRDRDESIDRTELASRLAWMSARLRDFGRILEPEQRDRFNDLLSQMAEELESE